MQVVILSRNSQLYSTRRLSEVLHERGHDLRIIDPYQCTVSLQPDGPQILFEGSSVTGVEVVIPRIGSHADAAHAFSVLRQFEAAGARTFNNADAMARADDKLNSLESFAVAGLAMPRTTFCWSWFDHAALIDLVGGAPVVIKMVKGTQGQGVMLAKDFPAADALIGSFQQLSVPFLVQEFIAESSGTDIRAIVIDDQVQAAMERTAPQGEFRSNIHRGGSARCVELSDAEETLVTKAARAIGLGVAGVDFVRSNRGPLLLEVNASPGLEGIENATSAKLAEKIVDLIEK
ncbi:RimK family alpha-L-glutamate ligase [Planctomycetota bacterium]|nr:RimK family alpha-L-glutamate ligase [Planctomycetota bacterium]